MKVSETELQDAIDLASATIATRYHWRKDQVRESEQFSDALLGIALAHNKFDPSRGIKFTTFCLRPIHWQVFAGERRRKLKGVPRRTQQADKYLLEALQSRPVEVDKRAVVEQILSLYPTDTAKQQRRLDILCRMYLDGESSVSIGKSYGVSDVAINQQRDFALREIRRYMRGREVPVWLY